MKFQIAFCALFGCLVAIVAPSAQAATFPLNPSEDVFVYEFNFSAPGPPLALKGFYANHLAVGATGIGHDVRALMKFDVASTSLAPAQVTSATLRLWTVPQSSIGGPPLPFADPGVGNEVDVTVFKAASSPTWNQSTAVWSNVPGTDTAIDTQEVGGVGQYVYFDVTSLVVSWLSSPASNNGLLLTQVAPVIHDPSGNFVAALFDSTDANSATFPLLTITAAESVPEPSTLAMAVIAVVGFAACSCWRRRSRLASRN